MQRFDARSSHPLGTVTRLMLVCACACVIAAAPQWAAAAAAQSVPGFITGLVRDASGAPIPGATVAVINERTGATAPAVSDEEGVYRSAALAAGAYRVEAALDGFDAAVRRVTLDVGQIVTVDVTLAPSQLTEAVVVTARRTEEARRKCRFRYRSSMAISCRTAATCLATSRPPTR